MKTSVSNAVERGSPSRVQGRPAAGVAPAGPSGRAAGAGRRPLLPGCVCYRSLCELSDGESLHTPLTGAASFHSALQALQLPVTPGYLFRTSLAAAVMVP